MSKKFKTYLPLIIVTVMVNLLVAGVFLVYADWQAPLKSPPTCDAGKPGCDAPVNVGGTGQTKSGALVVGSLGVNGLFQAFSNAVFSGNLTLGGVVKSTNSVYVCKIGQAPPCLGRFIYVSGGGGARNLVQYCYERASDSTIQCQLIYREVTAGGGQTCSGGPNWVLVNRSLSGTSYWSQAGCGGNEYVVKTPRGTPYGTGQACVDTATDVAFNFVRTQNCNVPISGTYLQVTAATPTPPSTTYVQNYELR